MAKKQKGGVAPDEDELLLPPLPPLLRQENNDLVAIAEEKLRDKPNGSEYYISMNKNVLDENYTYVLVRKISDAKYQLDNFKSPNRIILGLQNNIA